MNTLESVVDAALYKVLVVPGLALPGAGSRRSQAKGAPIVPLVLFIALMSIS